ARRARLGVGHHEQRAAADPSGAVLGRGRAAHAVARDGIRAGRANAHRPVHGHDDTDPVPVARHRRRALRQRCAPPVARRAARRAHRGGHPLGQPDRGRARTRGDRARRVQRPPLCAGARCRPGDARVSARCAARAAHDARDRLTRRARGSGETHVSTSGLPPRVAGMEATLPSTWYRSESVLAVEKERIFCREWVCAGREEELAGPGAFRVLDVLGESIILLRNREGELRGFYNVCRHRGARLCRAAAARASGAAAESPVARQLPGGISGGRITCPYHQWTYDLNGRLIAAPWLMSEPEFDQSLFSLYPVGVECWGGFVFVNLSPGKGGSLGEQLGAMPKRLAHYPLSELRIGHTIRYQVGANWKVLCENYNECYPCG